MGPSGGLRPDSARAGGAMSGPLPRRRGSAGAAARQGGVRGTEVRAEMEKRSFPALRRRPGALGGAREGQRGAHRGACCSVRRRGAGRGRQGARVAVWTASAARGGQRMCGQESGGCERQVLWVCTQGRAAPAGFEVCSQERVVHGCFWGGARGLGKSAWLFLEVCLGAKVRTQDFGACATKECEFRNAGLR